MRAVKKPIEVNVWQLDRSYLDNAPYWVLNAIDNGDLGYTNSGVWLIKTLEGVMESHDGNYLIEGVRGEIYPCEQSIFEETYILVEE